MSATIEKVVGARRSRLATIDAAIEQDEQALEAARRKFVELAEAEDAAVFESKRKNPTASPYALREPAQLIRDEREKLERTILALEKGLVALQSERVAAAGEQAGRELGERTDEARSLTRREREKRMAAAKAFAALVDHWNDLAEILTARSALLAQVAGERLVEGVGIFDHETIAAWEAVAGYIVEPVPTSFRVFIDELLEAALGERTDVEAEHAAVDEINARRRAMAATNPGGVDDLPLMPKPVIPVEPLHELVPDLRGEVRKADVTGVATRRLATPEPPMPEHWGEPAA
jgi:hypothetical protein